MQQDLIVKMKRDMYLIEIIIFYKQFSLIYIIYLDQF